MNSTHSTTTSDKIAQFKPRRRREENESMEIENTRVSRKNNEKTTEYDNHCKTINSTCVQKEKNFNIPYL
jgi:hypothetical protein